MSKETSHKDADLVSGDDPSTKMENGGSNGNGLFMEKALVPTIFPDDDDAPLIGSDLTTLKSFLQTTVTHLCPRLGIFSHVKWFSFVKENALLDANVAALLYWESINPRNLYPKTVSDLLNSYPVINYKDKLADIFQKPEKVINQWFADKTAGRPLKATFEVIDQLGEAARREKEYLDEILKIWENQRQVLIEYENTTNNIRVEDVGEIIFYVKSISSVRDPSLLISEIVKKLEQIQGKIDDSISSHSEKIQEPTNNLIHKLEEDLKNRIDDLECFFSVVKTIGKRQRKEKLKIEKEKIHGELLDEDGFHENEEDPDGLRQNHDDHLCEKDDEIIAHKQLIKLKEEWEKQRAKLSDSDVQSSLIDDGLSLQDQVERVVNFIEGSEMPKSGKK